MRVVVRSGGREGKRRGKRKGEEGWMYWSQRDWVKGIYVCDATTRSEGGEREGGKTYTVRREQGGRRFVVWMMNGAPRGEKACEVERRGKGEGNSLQLSRIVYQQALRRPAVYFPDFLDHGGETRVCSFG